MFVFVWDSFGGIDREAAKKKCTDACYKQIKQHNNRGDIKEGKDYESNFELNTSHGANFVYQTTCFSDCSWNFGEQQFAHKFEVMTVIKLGRL